MNAPAVIAKTSVDLRVTPNLLDYDDERRRFSWTAVARELAVEPGGGLNIAWQAVDRHCAGPGRDKTALRFLARGAAPRAIGYGELAALSNRFCNVLRGLGVGKGDRLFIVAGRIPELYVALLGSLKNGTVVSPLFSAFGPEPIATRVNLGGATVLVTTDALFERKIAPWRERMPGLKHVLLVAEESGATSIPGTLDFAGLMASASDSCRYEATSAEDMALLHFTSGTTGTPKGAVHVHGAALTHWATGRYALDLHADDVYWCTADPGWVTGTSYGIIAPLLHGVTSVVDREEFDAERWYGILADERVSVWYTAPTAVRMLMRAGAEVAKRHAFACLRFIASVGEPLNPEAVWWGKEVLGLPIHDNWWQTETGGIMIANTPAFDIKPGSMGRPLPGVDAAIVRRDAAGGVQFVDEPGVDGELALRRGWPSMFRGYLNDDARYRRCFAGDWYLTGDLARRDADGYYWFVGRADDVIKSAGHLIGPFEVESALMTHPAVAEAAVIGKPDPVVGETVKAFVSLNAGSRPDEALRMELLAHARRRLGAAVAPKEIAFVEQLPHTRSGKIMRRLLKARELGLAEGDTSTLEAGA
ncbi:acetate--CoA ligase [Burkholderia thailandensis]|uniref:acetate--CoA ligase n=1 Tax=Burkholderia thailandensis (strain ATCC 700388 / DSM 13276 / CCUG 48851 / CIP 106301 / E264) TaxID=271848 RepID=Q2T6S5_BURTA|nr:acetate--CoA ligase [Burkholderia thailandensis]ABC35104.1 acetyl-CoA synthetase [Burkholderia thailandensis E264]AHI76750.1 AMP-binding enzyme family protein [Burkholderia thailandensis 2002721723]AIP28167.1 AMP-binding enzyme family protein [Burkholderia thailandensis E264]AIS97742.1 AMP-binding enzyme family protein [Burkholderia thailandensis MSMB59]AJY00884.1 AMP-binding enzyme family protein [Burkholderia thailandensis 2002721643]